MARPLKSVKCTPSGVKHRDIAVAQEEHVARMAQDGRHVGRHEVFAIAQPDHHRRTHARRDNFVRIGARDHAQREHSAQFLHRAPDRFLQIALVVLLHQMRDHFGVGLGNELVPFQLKLVFELQIIFDDAVVYHHDVAGAIAMRMRVLFGGTAVRGPARVADAVRPVHRVHADGVFQVAQLSRRAPHRKMIVAIQDCDTGRVIPAVFQPPQAIQNDGDCSSVPDIADDAAHILSIQGNAGNLSTVEFLAASLLLAR